MAFWKRLFERGFRRKKTTGFGAYRVFTRRFDKVVHVKQLPDVLGRQSAEDARSHEAAWKTFQTGLEDWRTRWHLRALSSAEVVRAGVSEADRRDTTVSILIDQSGSMRGQPMLLAAGAVNVADQFLQQLECNVEILGFTTSSWQGGEARRLWKSFLRPSNPGRLCDLLHIIYRDGEQKASRALWYDFKSMLRPDLPKENIDGEALEWAAERLRKRAHRRKFLLIISDGVPADDSTLLANDVGILDRHLREVIAAVERDPDISLAAIGIGHDVSQHYSRSRILVGPSDLGDELISLLAEMLLPKSDISVVPGQGT